MTLPTDRSTASTVAEHVADHNTLHEKANVVLDIAADFGAVGDGTTDNTTRIQDAIDAVAEMGGGKVQVPATADADGYFKITEPLTVNSNDVFLDGVGPGSQIRSDDGTVLRLATTAAMTRFTMRDLMLRVNAADSACVEVAGVMSESLFQNSYFSLWNASARAIYASGSDWELLDTMFLRNTYDADANSSTVPVIDLVDTAGGVCNVNTFLGGRVIGSTGATAPLVRLSCQSASNYMHSNTLQGMNFQTNNAGAVLLEGNSSTTIAECGIFDVTTASADMIEIGKHASGLASRFCTVSNTKRVGGTIGSFYDIVVGGGAILTTIINSGASTGGRINLGFTRQAVINPAGTVFNGDLWSGVDAENDRLLVGGATVKSGTGDPEGSVTAGIGAMFLRTDGGSSTTLYVKESGSGNTGWVAK